MRRFMVVLFCERFCFVTSDCFGKIQERNGYGERLIIPINRLEAFLRGSSKIVMLLILSA
jgi:hypothetical protein